MAMAREDKSDSPEVEKEIPRFKNISQLYSYIEKEAQRRVRKLIEERKKEASDGESAVN